MILGSHNSWSYLWPKKWWQKLLFFTAKCQRLDIQDQYWAGVRCFDLRIRFINGEAHIVHNSFDYGKFNDLVWSLKWLNWMGDTKVRIIHDVRDEKDHTESNIESFKTLCKSLESYFSNIKFWCGRNLVDWGEDYEFEYKPKCIELYSSVCPPKILDDWIPSLYASIHNRNIRKGHQIDEDDSSILLIDFVDKK